MDGAALASDARHLSAAGRSTTGEKMTQQGKVIDVHAHVTPQRFQRAIEAGKDWHGLGPEYGELDNPRNLWDPERRLQEMDELGVDMQVVTPTDCFYQYDRDPAQTLEIAADANEEMAEMARAHPDRFMGMGTLPMQDPELAVQEMRRAVTELGLVGFMVDDHVNDLLYDDASFEPVFDAAEELGALLLIHQYQPTMVTARTEKYFLLNSIGNLADRTLSFGSFVYGGVMDRNPGLKIVFAHAGGYIPFAIDRIDQGWEMWPQERGKTTDKPSTYLRSFYYDTVTFTERNLRFLIDVVGSDRVVFGTDYPAPMRLFDPLPMLEGYASISDSEREDMLRGTAASIFDSSGRG
jgi:aminocarboxymuconate-semialdehyde decarboxylase